MILLAGLVSASPEVPWSKEDTAPVIDNAAEGLSYTILSGFFEGLSAEERKHLMRGLVRTSDARALHRLEEEIAAGAGFVPAVVVSYPCCSSIGLKNKKHGHLHAERRPGCHGLTV